MTTPILFLVTVLVNALWQPAVIASIAWLALKVSRCSNATTRHVVWTLALVASVVVPLVSAMPVVLPTQATNVPAPVRAVPAFPSHSDAMKSVTPITHVQAAQPAIALSRPRFHVRPTVATVASILWLIVALAILVRLLVSFFYLERLKRDALPLAIDSRHALTRYDRAEKGHRDVRICVSSEINVPVAVGIFDAMILLPSDLVHELDASDLDRVLLHELAHVRRSDDWVNLFERIAQALFFFSPGIYWITRQMDLEREVACDDWVLERSTENVPYARCLARIVELTRWPYVAPAAPGVFVTRKSMSIRIERLLARGRDISLHLTVVPTLLSLTLIAGIVVAGGFVSPTIAYTIDRGVTRQAAHAQTHRVARVRIASLPPAHEAAAATAPPAIVRPPSTIATPTTSSTAKVKAETNVAAKTVPSKSVAAASNSVLHSKSASSSPLNLSSASGSALNLSSSSGSASDSSSSSSSGAASTSKLLVADEGYLDDLAALGYKNLTIDEVIELKSLGVDREYIESLERAGYKNLTPRELVQFKSLGVTGQYVAAMGNAGLVNIDPRELVELKSLGVDPGYIGALASAGYPHLGAKEYATLKSLGVVPDYVKELGAAGLTGLSVHELTELKSLGVDGAYVRDLADNGYSHLPAREYVQLKSLGVNGDYIRKLANHGFARLTVEQLVRYKSLGISPQ
jgi:beta-lactamase regulating signal transducer with metallopeptidase domain